MKEQFTTEQFREKLEEIVNDEFIRFQNLHGIETGDLSIDLSIELSMKIDSLLQTVNDCMLWQVKNI